MNKVQVGTSRTNRIHGIRRSVMIPIAESVYFSGLCLYLLYLLQATMTFSFGIKEKSWIVLFWIIAACSVFSAVTHLIYDIRSLRQKWFPLLLSVCMLAAAWFCYRSTEYYSMLFIPVLAFGAYGIRYEKVIRCFVIAVGLGYLTAILCSWSGGITNLVYLRKGGTRSAWGFGYPTDFASYAVYLAIAVWAAWKKLPVIINLMLGVLSVYLAYEVADSETSFICSILFLLFCLLESAVHINVTQWIRLKQIIIKLIDIICLISFPLFAILTYILTYGYAQGNTLSVQLDTVLHGRLRLAAEAFYEHGIPLFGKTFEQIGAGGSTFISEDYNFVDSSYSLMVLRYGIILFLIITVIWIYIVLRAVRTGDRRLAVGMMLVAVHSFSEHHFPELNYNFFLLLLLTDDLPGRSSSDAGLAYEWRRQLPALISGGLAVLVLCISLPKALMILRTVVAAVSPSVSLAGKIWMAVIAAFSVCLGGVAFYCVCQIIAALLNREHMKKRYMITLFIVILAVIGGYLLSKPVVNHEYDHTLEMMDRESSVIDRIIGAGSGKFYAADDPKVYKMRFGKVGSSVYNGEELVRYDDTTVLVDAHTDSKCFIQSGFLYSQISDEHAVYTNDPAVITALKQSEIVLTGYYPLVEAVDLKTQSRINDLQMTENGSLEIPGPEKTMGMGPFLNLWAGKYTVSYDLELPESGQEGSKDEGELICILRVDTDMGENIAASRSVWRRDFDEAGRCSVEMTLSIPKSEGVEFKVYSQVEETILVDGITYQMTPDYDVHRQYDPEGRAIWEEYYDFEGNPLVLSGGYTACSYTYDKEGRCTSCWYYSGNSETGEWERVFCSGGYAGIVKEYDDQNRIRSEFYYGLEEEPAARSLGQYGVHYIYDEEGNRAEEIYLDPDGEPMMTSAGYASVKRSYTSQKKVKKETYYDLDGNPAAYRGDYYGIRYSYDDAGNQIRIRYLDQRGRGTTISGGYASIRKDYDEGGWNIAEYYYDSHENLCNRREGYAFIVKGYDEEGDLITQTYYDAGSMPVENSSGYAVIEKTYNEEHRVVRERYYDSMGNPTAVSSGYYGIRYRYDENGNVISERYLDAEGNLINNTSGYAILRKTWNRERRLIREMYYDIQKNPVALSPGQYGQEYRYDDRGNRAEKIYLDADGQEMMITYGYSRVCYEYNGKNQNIRESYVDTEGKQVSCTGGYARVIRTYDKKGNNITQQFTDSEEKAVMGTGGYSLIRRRYNEKNQKIWEGYYDTEGDLTDTTSGYAVIQFTYDEHCQLAGQSYYDKAGSQVERS